MNRITALHFPHTSISRKILSRLLLFFEKVYSYEPLKSDPPSKDIFVEHGLYSGYDPFPLDKDLKRFRQLLKDLDGHEDAYYEGYLSSLSLQTQQDTDEASSWNLFSRLTSDTKEQPKKESVNRKEEVWRAIFLLKLAEIRDRQEQEIEQDFTDIINKKVSLLKTLQGDKIKEDFLSKKQTSPLVSSRVEQRMKAWGQLYLVDKRISEHWLLATDLQEAADFLFEAYEYLNKKSPVKICSIPLPFLPGSDVTHYLVKRSSFRDASVQHRKKITNIFRELISKDCPQIETDGAPPELVEEITSWENTVYAYFSKEQDEWCSLDFYILHDTSFHSLFGKICHHAPLKPPIPLPTNHCLIAVLSQN